MFTKVLIANRGEIACRIIRTLDRMGIASVAVYSEADVYAAHVALATEAVCIGPASAAESYLRYEKILEVAQETVAQAIHPGYGFLSENAEFAKACTAAGIAFIGPTPEQMRQFGLKHEARALAQQTGVPLLPGTPLLEDLEAALSAAEQIHYPVMLKSSAGGGGIGLRLCADAAALQVAFPVVQRISQSNFRSDGGVYLEKYVEQARHIEVQIFGDGQGNIVALGERDCSVQRRNQKVIEETPAPGLSEALRNQLAEAALRLANAVNYQSAGTVEFVFDAATQEFYFLEVNTRLQVEHGVTELVYGIDLVEWMIRQAAGETFSLKVPAPQGHAIEVRLYAEDPHKNFQPSSGLLTKVSFPSETRCDTWVESGTEITPYYDPLIAKLLVHGENREETIEKLKASLDATKLAGIATNREYLRQILDHPSFSSGNLSTQFLNHFQYTPSTIDVLDPGTQTTIQDYPGRIGYWDIGVPPSGPMDHLAFRLANRLLGNPEGVAGLECTVLGPTLRFNIDTNICLTGAPMEATLDGTPVDFWTVLRVKAGSTLRLKAIRGNGYRTYLAVHGGFDVPNYLGSKATFTLGQFGGHCGRTLRTGDVLFVHPRRRTPPIQTLPEILIPEYKSAWEIGVLYGPHGAPDFFTNQDIKTFFNTAWQIHYNSARTGVRLIGPRPEWARRDGGEAGLHPSNIHDNAYAIGTVDFTGDMPVILGPDGPSLGGFVCPATIIQAELWKIGQLKPGDTVRFYCLSVEEALRRESEQDQVVFSLQYERDISLADSFITSDLGTDSLDQIELLMAEEEGIETLSMPSLFVQDPLEGSAILHSIPASENQIAVVYRPSGDKYLLVEYGPLVLDLNLRFRVHALMDWLIAHPIPGMLELTPGIRSLQIHYDSRSLPLKVLLEMLIDAEKRLPAIEEMEVPTRIIHMPLSWEDESTLLAISKYMQSVRSDAPWCPSNIEFIRRINGLESVEKVKEIVFQASYLVLGLGDVYLGAPVATPVDPRHRLVTTKYNPARTWTPENAVGIGGAYMCIYGMEGPGGYQFVGRTVQVWNRFKVTADFSEGKPWLLRFFDQIRFYPVTAAELLCHREDFLQGKFKLEIQEEVFSLKKYNAFLGEIAEDLAVFKTNQQAAFEAERERWAALPLVIEDFSDPIVETAEEIHVPEGATAVTAHISANVWQILVKVGDVVEAEDSLVILESMKMEVSVTTPVAGTVLGVYCTQGRLVTVGQILVVIAPN
jgi:urea carboxylase